VNIAECVTYKIRFTRLTFNFTVIRFYACNVGAVILYVINISVNKSFVKMNGLDAPQDCHELEKSNFQEGLNAE
jgi:hypothetical protein